MLSPDERARVARDFDAPAPPADADDESVGAFTTRRFGEAFTRRIAQPLLGGIHAGDVDRLSLRALFPPLADADAAGGSVLAALAARAGAPDGDGAFRGLRGGMGQLLAALARALPGAAMRDTRAGRLDHAGPPVSRRRRRRARGGGARRRPGRAGSGRRPPGRAVRRRRSPAPAPSCARCRARRSRSAIRAIASPIRCRGMGFIVPRGEATRLLAVSWVSSKWAGRAPRDWVVLRAFAGGAFDADVLDADRRSRWSPQTHADLAALLGISGLPDLRAPASLDRRQPAVRGRPPGARRRASRSSRPRTPGLFLTGSAYRGVGMPDVIADARATADRVCQWLDGALRPRRQCSQIRRLCRFASLTSSSRRLS